MRFAGIVSRATALAAAGALCGVLSAATASYAEDCPGNPDAIGTSRTLMIDPAEYSKVGTFNYGPLPLQDHEVVLTFDDGPIPPSTTRILDVLASQCVKANFFLVGEMARNYPWAVRRMYNEGHVIGTHSEDHPRRFGEMPIEKIRWEVDKGIADVAAALGDPHKMAPFFRFPGFDRSNVAEEEVAARHLVIFSTDTEEDDWRRHNAKQVINLAVSRLEKLGKGIILLHDIHPWTADALPEILKQLKEKGFHLVQVVPTPASVDAAVDAASEMTVSWSMAQQNAIDGSAAAPNWPAANGAAAAERIALLVPDADAFQTDYPMLPVAVSGKIKTASASESETTPSAVVWPDHTVLASADGDTQFPAPAVADIGWPATEKLRAVGTPAFVHSTLEARASRGGRHGLTRSGKHEIASHDDGAANPKAKTRFSRREDAKENYSRESTPKAARTTGHGNAHSHSRSSSKAST
jgi:peptidoglycan/xylan/chitin deacetylase (PgdA/CDA1 family)